MAETAAKAACDAAVAALRACIAYAAVAHARKRSERGLDNLGRDLDTSKTKCAGHS